MSSNLGSILEGILFIWGEPLELGDMENILPFDKQEIKEALVDLQKTLEQEERGIQLKRYGTAYQLVTIPEIKPYIEKLVEKTPRPLTTSSMEVLSIIAYKQPVTRLQIEEIRGVKSSSSIDTLQQRGLIEEKGRLKQIGRPILYGTTTEFLRYFNLSDLSQLPEVEENDETK